MKQEIHGNIEGVRRTLLEQMKALYQLEIDGDAFLPPELSQALAVFGDAHRHQRAAGKLHLRQVPEGAAQLVPVVPAGADHDLPVHHDPRLAEGPDIVQGPQGVLVSQHGAVELGVRGVNGDVDGADAQVDDPLGLPLRQVGQGDIVALQKAQPGVVVLKIQGLPHTGGHLVHEAEDAVVGAGAHIVHEDGVKIQAQVPALGLAQGHGPHGAGGLPQLQAAVGIVAVKAIVQHVDDLVAVDGQQLLPGGDPGPLRRAVPVHGGDDGAHLLFLFSSGGIIPQFIQTIIPKFSRFCKTDSGHFCREKITPFLLTKYTL